jgi:5-formyltetrahydrofolate cyclo-ligase
MRAPHDDAEDALRRKVKAELRTRMRGVRKALPAEARAARSARIAERVIALDEWIAARTVMLFVSMPLEVDTGPLERAARAAGKRIAAPRMGEPGLEVRAWDEGMSVALTGRMQVPEPPDTAPFVDASEIDLVVVPALALDDRGARIGYGAGLYDGLLPRLSRALRVGICFDFQRIAEVPETEGDQRLHVIVTDERVVRVD